jgi:hypothetical protein
MIRLLPILALLGCSTPLELPPPSAVHGRAVVWQQAYLPPGVLARADPVTRTVYYSEALLRQSGPVRAAVVMHEWCHLAGEYTEDGANRCAAERWSEYWRELWQVVEVLRTEDGIVWMEAAR